MQPCDAPTVGHPVPLASPSALRSIRGSEQFTMMGSVQEGMASEPAFASGVAAGMLMLAVRARSHRLTHNVSLA
ncbi:MAG: hypothetical protein ACKVIW_14935 [bacterium]